MGAKEKLSELLKDGLAEFSLDTGIISRIDSDIYTITYCENVGEPGLAAGTEFQLYDTYCADVVRTGKTRFYRDVAEITELLKHPCYLNTQLRAYVGTPVFNQGQIWGTLNYSALLPHKLDYSEAEIQFLENQARTVEKLLFSGESNDECC